MKHAASRELFAHWNDRRGLRALPERGDIEPAAIRAALGDTFIIGAEPGEELRFRLAGTRVCALFGRELRDETFAALWDAGHQAAMRRLLTTVGEEEIGVVGGAPAGARPKASHAISNCWCCRCAIAAGRDGACSARWPPSPLRSGSARAGSTRPYSAACDTLSRRSSRRLPYCGRLARARAAAPGFCRLRRRTTVKLPAPEADTGAPGLTAR